jgi:hypothetical protein
MRVINKVIMNNNNKKRKKKKLNILRETIKNCHKEIILKWFRMKSGKQTETILIMN